MANVMRTPDEGERLVRGFTRGGLGQALQTLSAGIDEEALDEYWKAFADDERRLAHLDLYRSGDFEKLTSYDGALAGLGLPTLILWGAKDQFTTPRNGERFHRELPGSELTVLEDAGHFIWEDVPKRTSELLVDFLHRRGGNPPALA